MKRVPFAGLGLFALLLLLAAAPRALAASYGVRDNAHFFSQDAISRANSIIQQIEQKHHKDVLVETLPGIPQDQQATYQQEGKNAFFQKWVDQRAHDNAVDGVYILITRNPGHIQAWEGNRTGQRLFTDSERDHLAQQILIPAFRDKQFDQGLIDGVQYIQQRMDAQGAGSARANSGAGVAVPPPTNGPNYPQSNYPRTSHGFGIGGLVCLGVAVVVIFMLIRGVMGRRNYGPGGYYPPGGAGYPPGGAGYPPAGGYGPGYGGGGGFGRGLLGGLLGGALGGYVGEKWADRGQQQGYSAPPPGPDYSGGGGGGGDYSSGVDTSGTSSGGDFDSGGGGGGADFSGGGGGGDFGGGGGDFGGGGGDSGSSGGGDF